MGALALAIGIAIQNFPEGAIISMPLKAEGMSKGKAFLYGVLSGVVEPIGAVLTVVASGFIIPVLPYFLQDNLHTQHPQPFPLEYCEV